MNDEDNTQEEPRSKSRSSVWQRIQDRLSEHGVYVGINGLDAFTDLNLADLGLDDLEDLKVEFGGDGHGFKVVRVSPDLKSSADEMKETQRDQVIMVRVDEDSRDKLDAWVKTGAVKSRSEAAALFIREGLKVREDELERLRDALREVEDAQERLHQKAREIFGGER